MTRAQMEADIATLRGLATKYIDDERYELASLMLNLIEQVQWAMPFEETP